jgi:hypothetical protein
VSWDTLQQPPFPPAPARSSSTRPFLQHPPVPYNYPLLFVIPRVCNFIGFEKKLTLKTKGLGASKVAKNQ